VSGPERSSSGVECGTVKVPEAAAELGISPDALYEAVRRKKFPALRIGKRVLISRRVLERVLSGEVSVNGD
jgi:excisionase family DNA binding protein